MTMTAGSSPKPPSVPSKAAQALRLRSLGLTNKQVAAVLDVPVPSARRLISEGKRGTGEAVSHDAPNIESGVQLLGSVPMLTVSGSGPHVETLPNATASAPSMPSGQTVYCPKHRLAQALHGYCVECLVRPQRGNDLYGGIGFRKRGQSFKKPTHLVIPDTQCKPGVPLDHLLWAGKYIAERKPDVVVHLGDHWDLPSLSSYEGKGSKFLEGKRLREDIAAGNRGLDLLMEGMGDYRPARMVLLRGNHEDRLTRAINESPTLLDGLVGFGDFNDVAHGWEVVDYLVPVTIDSITYSHYFYHPNTGRAYSGSVDNMLRNIGHSFTMGHQQGKRMGSRELGNGATQRGLVVGSFYQHDEDYKGPQGNSHWRGMVVCHEVGEGTYDLMEVSMDFLRRRFS